MSINCRSLPSVAPQLIVLGGSVELTPTNATPILVSSNTLATVYPNAKVVLNHLSRDQLEEELIWRQGKIAFNNTPPHVAVEKFSRYGPPRIVIGEPSLRQLTITGIYAADRPIGFARAVAKTFGIRAKSSGNGITLTKFS